MATVPEKKDSLKRRVEGKTAEDNETLAYKDQSLPKKEDKSEASFDLKSVVTAPYRFVRAFAMLFFPQSRKRFQTHRILGLVFLIQYAVSVYLFNTNYKKWLTMPLSWTVPLNGLLQSINAALSFTFLPKREEPGFVAVADNSPLSYYTVVENSFYALQALFTCLYLHDDFRPLIQRCVVVEPFFVFFIFYVRNLWPVSAMSAAHNNPKHRSEKNSLTLKISTYAIKGFYIVAKHYVYFFPGYLIFLGRLTFEDKTLLYSVQLLNAYASTISIFIHTLKFKGYIGPILGTVLYDAIIPGYLYLYYKMGLVIMQNMDVALVCLIAVISNLSPKPTRASDHPDFFSKFMRNWPFHFWQACVAVAFYMGILPSGIAQP